MNTKTAATMATKLLDSRIDSNIWHSVAFIGEVVAVLAKSKVPANRQMADRVTYRMEAHFEFHCANVQHTPSGNEN